VAESMSNRLALPLLGQQSYNFANLCFVTGVVDVWSSRYCQVKWT